MLPSSDSAEKNENGSSDKIAEPAPKQPSIEINIPEACANGEDCPHSVPQRKVEYNPF